MSDLTDPSHNPGSDSTPASPESLFHHARQLPPERRGSFLDRHCGSDPRLRALLEDLLRAADKAGDFLASNAATTASRRDPHALDRVGVSIGPYKLLQVIGEGGFGTVYLAEQAEPVRRKVALKIIKPGMDSRQVIARFEAERQALAIMDHPHIARVLDGGVTPLVGSGGGLPFFVMEYVVGDAITRFADAHRLPIRQRLDLFQQVCQAVQHAHTKGIIHRDLKPGNVLVSMVDGKPFAKVIDFGIAKALGGRLTDKTYFTEHRQLIGTPEYMSPEQAEGSPDIDTRTDVYALGVLLYELLTGETPLDARRLRSAAIAEMQRMIKDEEPPMPSVRLSRSLDALAATAQARQAEPGRLSGMVKGELDWIVMKALEKDRARRYETPNQLAADVQRHLAGEAVVAAPPSRAYRLRKFVHRNRTAVVTSAAIAATLLVGIAGTTWALRRANAQAAIAVDAVKQIVRDGAWRSVFPYYEHGRGGTANITVYSGSRELLGHVYLEGDREVGLRNPTITLLAPDAEPGNIMTPELKAKAIGGEQSIRLLAQWAIDMQKEINTSRDELAARTDATEWSAYTANLALAQQSITSFEYPEARSRLAGTPGSKQGWEHRFLTALADSVHVAASGFWNRAVYTADGRLTVEYTDASDSGQPRTRSVSDGSFRATSNRPVMAITSEKIYEWTQVYRLGAALQKSLIDNWRIPLHSNVISLAESVVAVRRRGDEFLVIDTRRWEVLGSITRHSYFDSEFRLSDDRNWILVNQWGNGVRVEPLQAAGGPERHIDDHVITTRYDRRESLWATRINNVPTLDEIRLRHVIGEAAHSGLTIVTPDGTRRIVGGSDKTVRFYDAKDGKPTLPPTPATPATAESPEGEWEFREVAVFRMPDAVTNLQMTGDGTRLIIHLADGSARVWDIRDPEERRKDLQAEWAERVPAGAYLDTLWASDMPDDKLRDAVVNDSSLTPLRRLVAAEMLEERLEDDRLAAEEAFEAIKQSVRPDETAVAPDPASITSAARAKAAAADLPPRVKARVMASAAGWEYKEPELTAEQELEIAAGLMAHVERGMQGGSVTARAALERVLEIRTRLLGPKDLATAEAVFSLGVAEAMSFNMPRGLERMALAASIRSEVLPVPDGTSLFWESVLAYAAIEQMDVERATSAMRRLGQHLRFASDARAQVYLPNIWPGPRLNTEEDARASAELWSTISRDQVLAVAARRANELLQWHVDPSPDKQARLAVLRWRLSLVPDLLVKVGEGHRKGSRAPKITPTAEAYQDAAREALAKARELIAAPPEIAAAPMLGVTLIPNRWAADADVQVLLSEAEKLLEGRDAAPVADPDAKPDAPDDDQKNK